MPNRAGPSIPTRIEIGFAILAGVIVLGTAGYMLIEGWSFGDAFFMTITTITTVGYREVRPLDTEGRIFTTFLILFGVGTAFYLLTTFVALVIEGDIRAAFGTTRMKLRIDQLSNHHILCGYGRVGEEISRELVERNIPFVVIDASQEALGRASADGHLVVEGDAASDETLQQAGIDRATALYAAADSDSGNTYITLAAKALNPEIFVVTRAGKRESEPRQRRAGADRVISPYMIGGRRMALSALQPNVVDFVDVLASGHTTDEMLAEVEVTPESGLPGRTLGDLDSNIKVLGVQRADGELVIGPPADHRLVPGDRLMVIATESSLEVLSGEVPGTATSGGRRG